MTTEAPAAVISPARFSARCTLCNVEIASATAWREHVAGAGHSLAVAGRQASLQMQMDQAVAELDRASKRVQDIVRALRLLCPETEP